MNAYDKMREALEAVLCNWIEDGFGFIKESTIEAVKQALDAPPRNCDVGTADEQSKRHVGWCDRLNHCSRTHSCRECFAKWAQMPYKEGGAK